MHSTFGRRATTLSLVAAGGCGSAIQIPADRAAAGPLGSTRAAVANRVGAHGALLFRDVRDGHRTDAVAYRVGWHETPCVFVYTDGRLTRVAEWDGGGATTLVPGIGQQPLCGNAGNLRPDALLAAESHLLASPAAAVPPDPPASAGRKPAHNEEQATFEAMIPIIVLAAPIWIPWVAAGRMASVSMPGRRRPVREHRRILRAHSRQSVRRRLRTGPRFRPRALTGR